MKQALHHREPLDAASDLLLAERAAARDVQAIRIVTARNNQRLFRAAWGILGNREDAEEVVQETYLKAFAGKTRFEGRSALSTWLTRIAINEALARRRAAMRRRRALDAGDVAVLAEYRDRFAASHGAFAAPDREVLVRELSRSLEAAIAALPPSSGSSSSCARSSSSASRKSPRRRASSRRRSRRAICVRAAGSSRRSAPRCAPRSTRASASPAPIANA